MKRNESTLDRILRAIGGAGAVIAGIMLSGPAKIILLVIGAVLLLTAAVGFCPLYRLFGLSTCKR